MGLKRSVPLRRPKLQGFTLLELLVVLAVMALALGAAALALRDPAQVALAQDGQRLATWLESGRATARASGQTVRWRPTDKGFELAGGPQIQAPKRWLDDRTRVLAVSVAGLPVAPGPAATPAATQAGSWPLVLGPEPILPEQTVLLGLAGHQVRVASDGVAPFALLTSP